MSISPTRSLPPIRRDHGTLHFHLDAGESQALLVRLKLWGTLDGGAAADRGLESIESPADESLESLCRDAPTWVAWVVAASPAPRSGWTRGLTRDSVKAAFLATGPLPIDEFVSEGSRPRPRPNCNAAFEQLHERARRDPKIAESRGMIALLLALLASRRPYWKVDPGPPAPPDWLPSELCRALRALQKSGIAESCQRKSPSGELARDSAAATSIQPFELDPTILEFTAALWRTASVVSSQGESQDAAEVEALARIELPGWWQATRWHIEFEQRLRTEKLESLRQLAYGASHEINNPLANISTRAQTLLRDETDPERRHKLAAIVAQAFRAHEMIANLMLFAKPPEPRIETFDFEPWWRARQVELEAEAGAQGTQLRFESSAMPEQWVGDPTAMAIVLAALVRNSREALGRGGQILVRCSHHPQGWVLRVWDSGPGLDEIAARHLFDPFFSGREAGRGLGFGLSKAWIICRSLGGDLEWVPSHEGGTSFEARLPKG